MTPARPIEAFSDHKVLLTPAGAWGLGDSPPRLSGLGYLLAYHPPVGCQQEALSAHSPGILRRHNEGTVGRVVDRTEVRALGGRGRCCNYTPKLTPISAPEGREKVGTVQWNASPQEGCLHRRGAWLQGGAGGRRMDPSSLSSTPPILLGLL